MFINPLQSVYWLVWWTKGNQKLQVKSQGRTSCSSTLYTIRLLVGVVSEEESETLGKLQGRTSCSSTLYNPFTGWCGGRRGIRNFRQNYKVGQVVHQPLQPVYWLVWWKKRNQKLQVKLQGRTSCSSTFYHPFTGWCGGRRGIRNFRQNYKVGQVVHQPLQPVYWLVWWKKRNQKLQVKLQGRTSCSSTLYNPFTGWCGGRREIRTSSKIAR